MSLLKYLGGYVLIGIGSLLVAMGIILWIFGGREMSLILIIPGVIIALSGRYYRAKGYRE